MTELWYAKRMAPEGVGVYNPAFDVTEAGLITGIITERGWSARRLRRVSGSWACSAER